MTDEPAESLIDQYDIDETDELYGELFDHVQDLRKRGHTPKEITPRLRRLADALEDHFGDHALWDKCPAEKNVVLPADDEEVR